MALPAAVQRIVDWLRAGYPEGVPEHDYMPLFALLTSHFSEEDVREGLHAVPELGDGEPIDDVFTKARTAPPSPADIDRVRAHLMSVGWDFDSAVAATSPAPPSSTENGAEPA
jgi:Protein of unknown function (DUF3349)